MSNPASRGAAASSAPEVRPFPFAVLIGAALAIVGLVLIVIGVGMGNDSSLFVVGAVVLGGGILRLTTALSQEARQRHAYLADPDDPRWHGGAGFKQFAGRSCDECGRKIVVSSDAVSCRTCEASLHVDCRPRHRAAAHA